MATITGTTVEEIRSRSEDLGVEFYFAQFVDMYGRPSAKLVPAEYLDDLVSDGAGFAGFAAGEIGQLPSDPDVAAIPDLNSFTPVPWEPSLARFACNVTVDGEEWPYDPRTILRRQLEKARTKGYEFMMGLELEYFLLKSDGNGGVQIADALDDLEKPCYDLRGLTRNYEFLRKVSNYVNGMGWGNYARGLGLSETAYHFIGGLKKHAKAYSAVTAPTVNSYKRLKLGSTSSGATWSPVWISYGYNNRTQMLRIPAPGRIEDRTVDGSCNPYLAAAVILAAGIDGIENGIDPGEPNSDHLYSIPHDELRARGLDTLPSNLLEATTELERDDVIREGLGEAG